MKTSILPSETYGYKKIRTQLFKNGVAKTEATQLILLVLSRARRSLSLGTMFLALMFGFVQQSFAQIVITNPTSPWTVPAGVTSIKVEVWGGGGAGGGWPRPRMGRRTR